MIRFIDLRGQDACARFAFFNTVTDRFLSDDFGDQTWNTIPELIDGWDKQNPDYLERMVSLAPDWAKEPETETSERTASDLVREAIEIHGRLEDDIAHDIMGARVFMNELKSVLVKLAASVKDQ